MDQDHEMHTTAGTGIRLARAVIIVAGVAALVSSFISFV